MYANKQDLASASLSNLPAEVLIRITNLKSDLVCLRPLLQAVHAFHHIQAANKRNIIEAIMLNDVRERQEKHVLVAKNTIACMKKNAGKMKNDKGNPLKSVGVAAGVLKRNCRDRID